MFHQYILQFTRAPGDVLVLTSLVRDIKRFFVARGQHCLVDVRSKFPGIWENNPYLTPLSDREPKTMHVKLDEAMAINASQKGERMHYVRGFHYDFANKTRIQIPCTEPRADLHLTEAERRTPFISGRYWIVVPGGKDDMTNKIWPQANWQALVDMLKPWGLRFVQEGATKPGCLHTPLNGVLNLIGKTSIRDLIINIQHAEGVITGVSLPMHIAGALEKPCVVLAGGREEPWWEEYSNNWPGAFGPAAPPVKVPHRFLHTIGQLPCCPSRGCWLRRIVPLNDGKKDRRGVLYDKSLCHRAIRGPSGEMSPECQLMMSPELVAEAVMSYYEDKTLKHPHEGLDDPSNIANPAIQTPAL